MLSAEDHPGVFTFMVGMIVVVMAAVGLSIMADKYRVFSGGAGELQREIGANATEIPELSARIDEQRRLLEDSGTGLHKGSKAHRELSAQLEILLRRQPALEKSRLQIRESITALEGEFSRYRADYRRKTRAAAIGESLGTLTARSGRAFQQATITRVTDVGLEIRHEHGIARIQAPELDSKLQNRFQWSDEERRSRLEEERENHEGKAAQKAAGETDGIGSGEAVAEPIPAPQMKRIPQTHPPEDAEKLQRLRLQVSGWTAKVSQLRIDRAEASSRASYGNQSSVPGSLETWVARSARLGRELLRAQAALAAAKADLATLAPNDPLLRVLEPGR